MDYDLIKVALTVVNMVITALVGVFVWQNRRQQVTVESIVKLEQETRAALDKLDKDINRRLDDKSRRLSDLHTRHSELSNKVSQLPSEHHIVRLHDRMDGMTKDFQNLALMLGDIGGKIELLIKDRT